VIGSRVQSRDALLGLLLAAALVWAGQGHAQTFEDLIDDVLKQHHGDDGGQPAQPLPARPLPAPAAPSPSDPFAPPPGMSAPPPGLVPVESGPRPYTPPKIDRPAEENVQGETSAPDGDTNGTALPADASAATGAERTRESLTAEEVNGAALPAEVPPLEGANPLVLKTQILLDRAGASPGVIDAYAGGNFSKAVAAVETVLGLPADGMLDKAVWDALGGDAAPAVLVKYTITAEDLAYPFLASIPADTAEQARLPNLNYTSPEEMLSERHHMDVRLLKALNPTADFRQAGTEIWVTAIDGAPITDRVARVVADRMLKQLRAYDAANHLIVAYPATIGSEQNPSPMGEHLLGAVSRDPVDEIATSGGAITLPSGPNNPLGTVRVDLTDPGYSIQGTDDPSKVGKPAADGCIRLANWDAEELADLVEPGVVVSFQ